jgi:hypothetical protein
VREIIVSKQHIATRSDDCGWMVGDADVSRPCLDEIGSAETRRLYNFCVARYPSTIPEGSSSVVK